MAVWNRTLDVHWTHLIYHETDWGVCIYISHLQYLLCETKNVKLADVFHKQRPKKLCQPARGASAITGGTWTWTGSLIFLVSHGRRMSNMIIKGPGVHQMSHESTFGCWIPRWLADFKEAGDGKSNADMSKIRPLRQKIWPLGTKVGCDWN